MAQQTLKKLKYDDKECIVEVAIRDGNGNVITNTYATQSALTTGLAGKQATLSEGEGIDISSNTVSIEKTSASNLGGMITGTGLKAASNGTVSLEIAGADQLGGVKIGSNISVASDGTISVTSLTWSNVSSKPFSTINSGSGNDFTVTDNKLYVNDSKFATQTWVGNYYLDLSTWNSFIGTGCGTATKPIYLSSEGNFVQCSTYAGGTKVTLNGSDKGASTASFYAPTAAGTEKNILVSAGSGAPVWSSSSTWSGSAGFLKVNANGVTSIDTNTYLTSHQSLSNYYTKAEIDSSLSGIHQFSYETASELPTASASTMYKIYIVPATNSATNNVKDEFITIDKGSGASPRYVWEQIGSTVMDLSNYLTSDTGMKNLSTDSTDMFTHGTGDTFTNFAGAACITDDGSQIAFVKNTGTVSSPSYRGIGITSTGVAYAITGSSTLSLGTKRLAFYSEVTAKQAQLTSSNVEGSITLSGSGSSIKIGSKLTAETVDTISW